MLFSLSRSSSPTRKMDVDRDSFKLGPPPRRSQSSRPSRPPVSRFQEGSMNDRVSAAPPAHFLNPEDAARFEKQFYAAMEAPGHSKDGAGAPLEKTETRGSSWSRGRRKLRPKSACAQLQGNELDIVAGLDCEGQQQQDSMTQQQPQQQQQAKNSNNNGGSGGFLGKVMGMLSFGRKNHLNNSKSKTTLASSSQEDMPPPPLPEPHAPVVNKVGKRSSYQQLPVPTPALPIKSQSQTHISHLATSLGGGGFEGAGGDRPSKEEILASYNQLMASGFFKSHAIQSTRQPPPGTRMGQSAPLPHISIDAPTMPTIPPPSREPPPPPSRVPPPPPPSWGRVPDSPASTASFFTMETSAPPSRYASRESLRYPLRDRKRRRDINSVNGDESNCTLNNTDSASVTSQQSQLAPKRSSKKLRKLPPTPSPTKITALKDGMMHLASSATSRKAQNRGVMHISSTTPSGIKPRDDGMLHVIAATPPSVEAHCDGIVRVAARAPDGSPLPRQVEEKAIRMRSPSPVVPTMRTSRTGNTVRGRATGSGTNRLQKRVVKSRSPRRRRSSSSMSPRRSARRVASRDKLIRDNWDVMDVDGTTFENVSPTRRRERGAELITGDMVLQTIEAAGDPEPLSVVPDANRGIPSVPKIPDAYKRGAATNTASWYDENGDGNAMDIDWRG